MLKERNAYKILVGKPEEKALSIYRAIQNGCRGKLSSGNFAPNSGNNHHLTIPFEGGIHSSNRQGAYPETEGTNQNRPLKPSPLICGTNSIIVLMFVESQRVHI